MPHTAVNYVTRNDSGNNRVARSQQQQRNYGMIKEEIACVSCLFIDVLTPECRVHSASVKSRVKNGGERR